MVRPPPTPASRRRRWFVAIVAILLVGAAYATDRVLHNVPWHEVFAHIAATPTRALVLALLLTTGSYLVLTQFDALAVRAIGAHVHLRTILMTSFAAFAVGHNIGFAALSGGSIRLRWYSRAGLSAWQITQLIAFCSFTSLLGAALLCGLSLTGRPHLAGNVLHIGSFGALAVGLLFIALVVAYCLLGVLRREPLVLGRLRVPTPQLPIALGQVAVGSIDLMLAAGVLYVLLPDTATHGFLAFLSVYLLSVAAGLASSLPGGIGVFETVLLLLLPDGPTDEKLAAMLAYRAIYYLLPFVLALTSLATREAWVGRAAVARSVEWARAWLRLAVPQLISAAVFTGGVLLLFSGATPAEHARLRLLRGFVPLPLLETSHLLGSAVGISLVLLAQGLQRRLDAAWHVTMWLLAMGIFASLVKGLDYEEALALTGVAVLMLASRDRFQRKASLLEQPFSPGWTIAMFAALLSSLGLAWLSYRNVNFTDQMWWEFAFRANAPRTLRAEVLTIVITGFAAAWMLLRPARHQPRLPDAAALQRARQIVEESGDTTSWLAMLGDKNLLFSDDGRGFVMYRPVGRNWIAMGDPVGPPKVRHEMLWRFREACDRYAARPVFYQVGVEDLPAYIEAGFVLSKIGEEARVPLAEFDLEGGRRADLRQDLAPRAAPGSAVRGAVARADRAAHAGTACGVGRLAHGAVHRGEGLFTGALRGALHRQFPVRGGQARRCHPGIRQCMAGRGSRRTVRGPDALLPERAQGRDGLPAHRIDAVGTRAGFRLVQPGHGAAGRPCRPRVRAAVESRRRIPVSPRRALLQFRGTARLQGEIPAGMAAALPGHFRTPGPAAHRDGCGGAHRGQPAAHRDALKEGRAACA